MVVNMADEVIRVRAGCASAQEQIQNYSGTKRHKQDMRLIGFFRAIFPLSLIAFEADGDG